MKSLTFSETLAVALQASLREMVDRALVRRLPEAIREVARDEAGKAVLDLAVPMVREEAEKAAENLIRDRFGNAEQFRDAVEEIAADEARKAAAEAEHRQKPPKPAAPSEPCKRCEAREYYQELYTPTNNPKGHPQKYAADHGQRITVPELVDGLLAELRTKPEDDGVDWLDREFLFGCWRDSLEGQDPTLLRNLRGLILSLAERVIKAESPGEGMDPRLAELLQRLVAPGEKCANVSASECHEIVDEVYALQEKLDARSGGKQ